MGDSLLDVQYQIALAAVSAALLSTELRAAGGSCLPRALTPAEKVMGDRVAAQLLPMLPAPPPGWKISDPDPSDISAGTCLDSTTKKMVLQPVSVLVRRKFMRTDPPPATAVAAARELMEIRAGQRSQREARNMANTDAAFAPAKEELAARPVASVALLVNSDQASLRAAKPITVAGVEPSAVW